jgi:hypothetical protein
LTAAGLAVNMNQHLFRSAIFQRGRIRMATKKATPAKKTSKSGPAKKK